ncbi:Abi family protein [Tomitella cavernea]|uniref:Abi family protein n=1 Tax=Tomitella cavernea TaxID=1387982 RepID=A0ABP9D468_9ACTN
MPHPSRPRGSLDYAKPPLALDDLVDRLAQRGLDIPDRDRARRYLRHIGYYRLSPYTIPFHQQGAGHLFREGVRFDDVLDLYVFDRALRLLVMDALERAEVAIRAALTDHMSTTYNDPHWYTDPSHFHFPGKHSTLLKIVRDTCDTQLRRKPDVEDGQLLHRSALEHYLTTYRSPELPPSWLMVETLTIGQLDNAYRNLGRRPDRTAIARSLGLTAPILQSWMQTYVRVRNICAHHGRCGTSDSASTRRSPPPPQSRGYRTTTLCPNDRKNASTRCSCRCSPYSTRSHRTAVGHDDSTNSSPRAPA